MRVVFLGGEPLADRNCVRYVQVLSQAGVVSSISTNGTLITDELAQALAGLDVSVVAVSLDGGNAALNDKIRGRGSFQRIVTGIETLVLNRRGGVPRIAIACTLAPENYGGYDELFQLAGRLGVVDVFINKHMSTPGSTLTADSANQFLLELDRICKSASRIGGFYLYLPTMPRVAEFLAKRHEVSVVAKEMKCPAVDEALLLSDDDRVYPCSMARVERPEYGTMFDGDILRALESPQIQSFVRKREESRDDLPMICFSCRYASTCATRCVLTSDQSKYYLACEALEGCFG